MGIGGVSWKGGRMGLTRQTGGDFVPIGFA